MKLADYISEQRGRAKALADKTGLAPSTIGRIAKGEHTPTRTNASNISAATDGVVSVAELFGFESAQ